MWVFDGETWIDEGGGTTTPKPETIAIPLEDYWPELQVVEIQIPKSNPVPPIPLP